MLLSICTKPSKVCVQASFTIVMGQCNMYMIPQVSSVNQYKIMVTTTVQTMMAQLLTLLIPVLRVQLQAEKRQSGT